jgi:hypothetical protein
VLHRRVATLLENGATTRTLLCYSGSAPPGGSKAQAAACNALRNVLAAAGLGAEPDVRMDVLEAGDRPTGCSVRDGCGCAPTVSG